MALISPDGFNVSPPPSTDTVSSGLPPFTLDSCSELKPSVLATPISLDVSGEVPSAANSSSKTNPSANDLMIATSRDHTTSGQTTWTESNRHTVKDESPRSTILTTITKSHSVGSNVSRKCTEPHPVGTTKLSKVCTPGTADGGEIGEAISSMNAASAPNDPTAQSTLTDGVPKNAVPICNDDSTGYPPNLYSETNEVISNNHTGIRADRTDETGETPKIVLGYSDGVNSRASASHASVTPSALSASTADAAAIHSDKATNTSRGKHL